jgi:hypothetical protein
MQRPSHAYLRPIPAYPDLPVVTVDPLAVHSGLLLSLGVRQHVGLAPLLASLRSSPDTWRPEAFVRHLGTMTLQAADVDELSSLAFLRAEGASAVLHAPRDLIMASRETAGLAGLPGLRLLAWQGGPMGHAEEQLLRRLGVREGPALQELLVALSDAGLSDAQRRGGLVYLLGRMGLEEGERHALHGHRFIPCRGKHRTLVTRHHIGALQAFQSWFGAR